MESNVCILCNTERASIMHTLWECHKIVGFISEVFDFLNRECKNQLHIHHSRDEYLFGFMGGKFSGLNLILLELKIFIFYTLPTYNHFDLAAFLKSFLQKIMAIILKEKCIAIEEKKYLSFESKWSDYTAIYDFRGPDNI